MKVYFKYKKLQNEWKKLLFKNPKLVYIVLLLCKITGGQLTITNIFRTNKQQRKLYPGQPFLRSVHEYWRGVDVRIRKDSNKGVDFINAAIPYGKPGLKTALIHDIGHGNHVHLQVKA